MRTLTDHLVSYARYHRDPRNIATHVLGIPLIVFAVTVLLSRPAFVVQGITMSPALFVALGVIAFYIRLHLGLAAVLAAFIVACLWVGAALAQASTLVWLGTGLGVFVFGWVLQFIGHYYEGKKPAFVDDLIGLLQGPLFLLAEGLLALGWRPDIKAEIERQAGPIRMRETAQTA
jgi:uncharacterized membrane protein YGL010W